MDPKNNRRLPNLFLAVAAVSTLAACGGGRGTSETLTPPAPPPGMSPDVVYVPPPYVPGGPPPTFYDPPAAGPMAGNSTWVATPAQPPSSNNWTSPSAPTPAPAPGTNPPGPPITTEPPPPPPPPLPPAPTSYPSNQPTVIYLSDCQTGAAAGCIRGNDGNQGTSPNAPKATLASVDINSLGAGSKILFACGGVWTNVAAEIRNTNVTPASPLTLDQYTPAWGCAGKPTLRISTTTYFAFQFGNQSDTVTDGGYTLRNLKLDGGGRRNTWGVHLRLGLRSVSLENVEISGFARGILAEQDRTTSLTTVSLKNSYLHHNIEYAFQGSADNLTVEGTTFSQNNSASDAFGGAMLLTGRGRNLVLRGNTFQENSVTDGRCDSEIVTMNGQWDGILVELNKFLQTNSGPSCTGLSMFGDGSTTSYFRNAVVRQNIFSNLGSYSITATSTPGIVVENNLFLHTLSQYHAAVVIHDRDKGTPQDDEDTGAVVRNNTLRLENAGPGSEALAFREGSGRNIVVASNLVYFGAGSDPQHYCFAPTARVNYLAFDYNLCYHAGPDGFPSMAGQWSAAYYDTAQASAAGYDQNGVQMDPLFVTYPTAANGWDDTVKAPIYGLLPEDFVPGGAGIDRGHPNHSVRTDRLGNTRGQRPDIGTREQEYDYGRVPPGALAQKAPRRNAR